MHEIEWVALHWLWLLLLLPIMAYFIGKRGPDVAILFPSCGLFKGYSKPILRSPGNFLFFLRILALGCLIIAMARPRLATGFEEKTHSGLDIMLAVDVSSSMLARDFATKEKNITRLEAVKDVINDFIEDRPHDRMGMVAFAGYAYLISPLTLNHEWLIRNMETNASIGEIEDGTAIGSAIGTATDRLRGRKDAKSKIIILLTDGVNNAGKVPPLAAAEAAAAFDIKIYTIAAGSDQPVTVYLTNEDGSIARNRYGRPKVLGEAQPVDAETMKEVAEITDGRFFRARDKTSLKEIYKEIDRLEKTEVNIKQFQQYDEWFLYPLLVGMAILWLEWCLARTRLRTIP